MVPFAKKKNHWIIGDLLTNYNGYVSKSLLQLLTSSTWIFAGEIRVRHHFWKIPGQNYVTSNATTLLPFTALIVAATCIAFHCYQDVLRAEAFHFVTHPAFG